MDILQVTFPLLIILTGVACRLPFRDFPLDDDFAIYTYRARFADRGFQWKRDLQIIGIPIWRMLLLDKLYGNSAEGVRRIRHLQTVFHVAASLVIYGALMAMTQNPWAALGGGLLHACYGTSPDLTAGSFNHEQFYIPWTLLGLAFLTQGPEAVFWAGACFGLATIPKYTTGLYAAALTPVIALQWGLQPMAVFILACCLPFTVSNGIEWKLGFWDAASRAQMRTRMATTLRLTRTKSMYFSVAREIRHLILQTLPLWVLGAPGLIPSFLGGHGIWFVPFTGVTLFMIFAQRGFSRYHYLPWLALLALGGGLAMDGLHQVGGPAAAGGFAVFLGLTLWNLYSLRDFYLRPAHPETLARYEKFDQYIYLPHLGKILKRLVKRRGESGERIFVWGTFSQLYHYTDLPAADNFLHHTIGPWDTPALTGFFDSVIGGLVRHKPVYLIKSFPDLDLGLLEEVTGLGYEPVKAVLARFGLYRLARRAPAATDPLSLPWKDKMRILEALTAGDWHAPRIDRSDLARGKPATALKECRKLVRLNPHDWMGLIYMGEILDQGNRPEEAARAFEKALDEQPLCEHVRLMLAKQKIRLGQLDTAGDLLAEETRRFGENTETIYLTALHHQKRGNHREAAAGFERFRTLVPNRHDAWQSLMESLTELKDREGLRRVFAEAANTGNRKDREWLQTQAAVALARLDADQRPEHETLGHYLQQDPENSLLLYARASALERMGEPERAFSLFEQAARSADTYGHIRAGAWFRLARLSSGEQKKEFARRCLKLDPSHEGARNLLTRPQRDRSEDEKAPATEQRPASEAC